MDAIPGDERLVALSLVELENLIAACLKRFGCDDHHVDVIKDVLMYAELRGKSQGLSKLVERTVVPADAAQPMLIDKRSAVVTHITCRGEVGMVVLARAAEIAIDTALAQGVGVVSSSHTASSTGSIGFYADQIARRGGVGIVMAGSPAVMAVAGSTTPTLGTNPIAIAVPTDPEPLVFDMATAAVTWFELIDSARRDLPIEPRLAYDEGGRPTTDAASAMAGALRSFGGYKGSGLGLMFELLTGPLIGASIVGDSVDNRGNLVVALDPERFDGLGEFRRRSTELLDRIRSGRREDPAAAIRLPGESGRQRERECRQRGTVFVDKEIIAKIEAIVAAKA